MVKVLEPVDVFILLLLMIICLQTIFFKPNLSGEGSLSCKSLLPEDLEAVCGPQVYQNKICGPQNMWTTGLIAREQNMRVMVSASSDMTQVDHNLCLWS